MTNKKRCYAYYRITKNSENSEKLMALRSQKAIVKKYCNENNITIAKEFIDSTTHHQVLVPNNFKKMLSDIYKNPEVNTVVSAESIIFEKINAFIAKEYFFESKIRFIGINDFYDSRSDVEYTPLHMIATEIICKIEEFEDIKKYSQKNSKPLGK